MSINKNNKIDRLSGVTALILTALSCVVTIASSGIITHIIFVLWLFILFMFLGIKREAFIYLIVYLITFLWLMKLVPLGIKFPSPMLVGMIYKFTIPIMAACLTFKIPSGKVINVFQKFPIPRKLILILVVMIRFIPTVSGEVRTIKEAMRVRGFLGSFRNVLCHPLKMLEYGIVPIIFRTIKIGDELAAASIVRGIDNPGRKYSYYSCSLCKDDYIILVISSLLGIVSIIY